MGKPLPPETRAAVLAALLEGQNVSQVAREFHIDRATVIQWRRAAGIDTSHSVSQEKSDQIGELVLRHVASSLRALEALAGVTTNREWLEKQSAENVAVFYGVVADKSHRVLAALEPEQADETATAE